MVRGMSQRVSAGCHRAASNPSQKRFNRLRGVAVAVSVGAGAVAEVPHRVNAPSAGSRCSARHAWGVAMRRRSRTTNGKEQNAQRAVVRGKVGCGMPTGSPSAVMQNGAL